MSGTRAGGDGAGGVARSLLGSRRDVVLLALLLVGAAGLIAPHLSHPYWQDEVKTLELFASDGFLHPFQVYPFPNNHVLSSALIAVWRDIAGGDADPSVRWMRALPATAFLVSVALLGVATARLGGARAGLLASALFATSHVALSFATELRGYGLSWLPVVVAFVVVPGFVERGGAGKGAAYAAATAASVAILPTNLVLVGTFGVWGAARAWLAARLGEAPVRRRLAFLWLAPLLGGLAYVGIAGELLSQAGRELGSWTLGSIVRHWLWATLIDFAGLGPIALWGAVLAIRSRHKTTVDALQDRGLTAFCACVAVTPLLALALLPNTPYARNLVPMLPLWYAAIALLFERGWRGVWQRAPRFETAAFGLLLIALFAVAGAREQQGAGYADRHPGRPHELVQDLYDQYYHYAFRPEPVARALLERMRADPGARFLTDHNGLWVIGAEVERLAGRAERARLVHFRDPAALGRNSPADGRIFLVGHSLERAREMTRLHGLPEARDEHLVDTSGFFAIFEVPAQPNGDAKR